MHHDKKKKRAQPRNGWLISSLATYLEVLVNDVRALVLGPVEAQHAQDGAPLAELVAPVGQLCCVCFWGWVGVDGPRL